MHKILWIYLLPVLTVPAYAQTSADADLAARVARLESRQSGPALMEMLDRIDRLQNEVQQLRGDADKIQHDLDRIGDRQQSLYLDLDKRLLELERAGAGSATPPPAVPDSGAKAENPQTPAPAVPPPAPSEVVPIEETASQGTSDKHGRGAGETGNPDANGSENPDVGGSGKEASIYQEAFVYLNNGRYDDAIADFSRLIEAFPSGEYADNSQYWLGETYYVKREFDSARANFNQVMEKYPDSHKVPDALLKLGYIEYEESKWKSAREILKSVIQRYPDSNAAQLAQHRLDRMRKQGH
ncbi:MAG: tol-pal system protein YbgF [Methylococcaceae bacterium]|nr:tol-pal system protein YbgF [Methylococcaceae bacterium]MCI0733086.1 tol-pal system protein YbgF [Methylococcaceae bacterium]